MKLKKKVFVCGIIALMIGMVSCKTQQKNMNRPESGIPAAADGTQDTTHSIVEKYWKLTELFGEAVVTPEGGRNAHLILKEKDNRVNGNGGCNTLNGTYTLMPENKISFSQMASTMMMCINMDVETKMKKALELTDKYTVNYNSLILYNSNKEPIARFEVVYL